MTIPEILAEMRHLMRRKDTLQDRLERAQSAATTSGGLGDGMPSATAYTPKVERYGLYIADLRADIERIDRKLEIYTDDIRHALASVDDALAAEMIRLRYVEQVPVRIIAAKMNYVREYAYEKLREAEKHLT